MKKKDHTKPVFTPCGCADHAMRPSRREFMYAGLVGGLGLSLPQFFRMQAAQAEQKHYDLKKAECDSVIHIFLPGGMAAQESFDPKPLAPSEYRGPFSPIDTNVTGIQLSQTMRHTAKVADKVAFIRSMTHGEAAHERGTHNMFTGYRPSPAIKYPSMGSVVSHELGAAGELPPYICVPNQPNEHAGSGYLSNRYGPFSLGANPSNDNFRVRDLSLPNDIDHERFARRQQMLDAVDDHFRSLEESDALDAMDEFYSRAYSMISSTEAREAFNLAAEPEAVRNKYGKNPAGMRLLLARRLAEAGVRFISTTYGGWDHHQNIQAAMTQRMPELDQAYAALISDLDERGMLGRTMVMMTTEFGRTPKINGTAGRDHFPRVFSVAMAGGGFKGGMVYGKSDATSTAVGEDPVSHEDLATTVYNQLGIIADKELMAPGDRPIEIVDGGRVLSEVLDREA